MPKPSNKATSLTLRIQPTLKLWLESQATSNRSTVSKLVIDILQREQSHELDLSRIENSIESLSGDVDKLRAAVAYLAKNLQPGSGQ